MITATEYFPDDGVELRATFTVDSMANAIGCEPEHRSAFPGFIYELDSCKLATSPFTDIANDLAPHEMEYLIDLAADKHSSR